MSYARDPSAIPEEIIDYGPTVTRRTGITVPIVRRPVAVIDSDIPLTGNQAYAPVGQTALVTTAPVQPDRTLLYVVLGAAVLYLLTRK